MSLKKILIVSLVFIACSSNEADIQELTSLPEMGGQTDKVEEENFQVTYCEEFTISLRVLFLDYLDPALRRANNMAIDIRDNPFPSERKKLDVKESMLSLINEFEEINRKLKRFRPDEKNKEAFFLITNGIEEYEKAILNTARVYNISATKNTVEKSLDFMQSAEDKIEQGRSLRYTSCEY